MSELLQHKFNTILIGVAFSTNLKNNIFEALRMVDFFDCRLIMVPVGEKTNKKENKIKALLDHGTRLENIMSSTKPDEIVLKSPKIKS